jgi:hypothetical protein
MIHEVAIDVGILFVDAPVPGKAKWVQRMQEHELRAFRHALGEPHPQQTRLYAGAEIAFDAMRSRDQKQCTFGSAGARGRHIHEERLSVCCIGLGVNTGGDAETVCLCGCNECIAGAAVVGGKMLFGCGCHGHGKIVLSPRAFQRVRRE